jgi:hypothetical protein
MTSGNRCAAVVKNVKVHYQTLRLGAPRERTGAERVSERVPTGCANLSVHPAPGRWVTDRIQRIGAVILREATAPTRVGARADVELRDRVDKQLSTGVEHPISPMRGRRCWDRLVDRRTPIEPSLGMVSGPVNVKIDVDLREIASRRESRGVASPTCEGPITILRTRCGIGEPRMPGASTGLNSARVPAVHITGMLADDRAIAAIKPTPGVFLETG